MKQIMIIVLLVMVASVFGMTARARVEGTMSKNINVEVFENVVTEKVYTIVDSNATVNYRWFINEDNIEFKVNFIGNPISDNMNFVRNAITLFFANRLDNAHVELSFTDEWYEQNEVIEE